MRGQKVELDVGAVQRRVGFHETTRLGHVRGEGAATAAEPLQRPAQAARGHVPLKPQAAACADTAGELGYDVEVVGEALADKGGVDHVDAVAVCSAGPMPESMSRCGLLIAPA